MPRLGRKNNVPHEEEFFIIRNSVNYLFVANTAANTILSTFISRSRTIVSMDTNYFQQIINEETPQAQRLAEVLVQLYNPASVADYGCATGLYLEPFAERGIEVVGYDNSEAAIALTKLPGRVHRADLTKRQSLDRTDLSICLEVLEHIEAKDAVKCAKTIASKSNILVFSAAHPGQGGEGHINCRPQEYWEGVFNAYGMQRVYDDAETIISYMQQGYHMGWLPMNLMVFKKK